MINVKRRTDIDIFTNINVGGLFLQNTNLLDGVLEDYYNNYGVTI